MRNKRKVKNKTLEKKYTLFEHLKHTHTTSLTQGRSATCTHLSNQCPFAWLFVCVLLMSILGHVCSVFFQNSIPPSLLTPLDSLPVHCSVIACLTSLGNPLGDQNPRTASALYSGILFSLHPNRSASYRGIDLFILDACFCFASLLVSMQPSLFYFALFIFICLDYIIQVGMVNTKYEYGVWCMVRVCVATSLFGGRRKERKRSMRKG